MSRFGLIGAAGFIAPRHMRAIRDTQNELVVATDPHDAVGILDTFAPNATYYPEFERFQEYIAQANRDVDTAVDLVSVCSPNHLHRAHIAAAMRLGCDVICEKPLVPTSDDLKELRILEEETQQRVHTILQLRHHPAILELRERIRARGRLHDVNLTYVTSRGKWYAESWKADPARGYGVMTNIGIHFFDMLHFVFGDIQRVELHKINGKMAAGALHLDRANVQWMLSIDERDLPQHVRGHARTFRSVTVDGHEIEFSDGFTDLHTVSYDAILRGQGFGIDDAEPSILVTEELRKKALALGAST